MLKKMLLLTALLAPWTAQATSVVYMPPAEQAMESTAIVDAVVGSSVQVQTADGVIFTDTTLVVRDVVAGAAPAEIALRQHKGTRPDGSVFFAIGDGQLDEGQRVVAFVRQVDGHWYLTAMGQSVWHVDETGKVEHDTKDLAMFERTLKGVVPAQSSPQEPDDLAGLLSELRGLECGEVAR